MKIVRMSIHTNKALGSKNEKCWDETRKLSCCRSTSDFICAAALYSAITRCNTEKGDALKTARIAGILGAKRTDELIPLCHPLPIYRADGAYVAAPLLEAQQYLYEYNSPLHIDWFHP